MTLSSTPAIAETVLDEPERARSASVLGQVLRRLRGAPRALTGLGLVGLMALLALFAPLIARYNPDAVNVTILNQNRNRSEGARRYAATGSGQIRGGCCAWGKRDGGGAAVVRAAQASVR